jgi:phage gp36-like protein
MPTYATIADLTLLSLPLSSLVGVSSPVAASAAVVGAVYIVPAQAPYLATFVAPSGGGFNFTRQDTGTTVTLAAETQLTPTTEIVQHLANASSRMDSYLGIPFCLPLRQWGDDVKGCACDIAAYTLMGRRGFNPTAGSSDLFLTKFNAAVRWLEHVGQEKAKPSGVVDSAPTGANNTLARPETVFAVAPVQSGPGPYRHPFHGGLEDDFDAESGSGVAEPIRRGW